MATGYTSVVEEGEVEDLSTFILRCARAMGACVMMRDEPLDVPPPRVGFTESPYYVRALQKAEAALEAFKALPPQEKMGSVELAHKKAVDLNTVYDTSNAARLRRVEAMIAKVEAWKPPTGDHEGLKAFMLDQLKMSLPMLKPRARRDQLHTMEARMQEHLSRLEDDVRFARESLEDERERMRRCNDWIAALYNGLA